METEVALYHRQTKTLLVTDSVTYLPTYIYIYIYVTYLYIYTHRQTKTLLVTDSVTYISSTAEDWLSRSRDVYYVYIYI